MAGFEYNFEGYRMKEMNIAVNVVIIRMLFLIMKYSKSQKLKEILHFYEII